MRLDSGSPNALALATGERNGIRARIMIYMSDDCGRRTDSELQTTGKERCDEELQNEDCNAGDDVLRSDVDVARARCAEAGLS